MIEAGLWKRDPAQGRINWPDAQRLARAIRPAGPAILFGLRLWASVCLALFVAFALELDNAYWAGTSAAIVCQPSLGASLRKASFRMVGTIVGAVGIVVLTGLFPQSRLVFFLSLALWCAACGFIATILRNFASYAAALAGFTAVIIAEDQLGATGGLNGQAFELAVTRATEICIGIVSAGVVLAGTDFGNARRRLAAQLAGIAAEVAAGLSGSFLLVGPEQTQTRPIRRNLTQRISGLDAVIDEAIGEASDLRYRTRVLQAAVDGSLDAVARWRTIAGHLERLPIDQGRSEAELILGYIPKPLSAAPAPGDAALWAADPSRLRRVCRAAARALIALPADTPSLRLLADQTAAGLFGISHLFNGLALLTDPASSQAITRLARVRAPDLLPPLINGIRVIATMAAAGLLWIATAWPSGALALAFAAIVVILFPTRGDQANPIAMSFMLGTCVTAVLAGIVLFAILPNVETFPAFSIAIGVVLVPAAALQLWRGPMFTAVTANFIPILAPANPMSYDIQQFSNSALAIVAGTGAGVLALHLLPQLSPATRVRRLLALTLGDLRRLATGPLPSTADWAGKVYGRLSALPAQADPLQTARLATALSAGAEIIWLRRIIPRFGGSSGLDPALDAVARGDSQAAIKSLADLDRSLAARPGLATTRALRARGRICALSEALAQHAPYFDGALQ